MKPRHSACNLLVFCSVLWVVSSSVNASPPGCDSTLAFSSDVASSSEGNGNIHSRSLSPWSWRSSTVKNRIPATLWEAECSNSFCSSPNPGQPNKYNMNSVPIYQNVLVLNQQRGVHCYTASYLSVAVGCTCVVAKTNQN
ncbi:interleukin 17a/f2 [Micropterus salmoides]|uniref:interleukin 17a/f2 n=1 Tax=Micropterus salmoides TaxID=27706 RepID=UPI0018EC4FC9|nr:interleukin 17a/f2 [Micropterus salmoides]